jgi:hypothetical protein
MLSLGIKEAVIIFTMPVEGMRALMVGLCLGHKLALIPALYIIIWFIRTLKINLKNVGPLLKLLPIISLC